MTNAETHLWQHIRARQILGLKFRRQHSVGNYILDFACIDLKLSIEVDGGQHSEMQSQDNLRTAWLETQGWKVLRFGNNEVLQNIEGVLEQVYNELSNKSDAKKIDRSTVLPPPCIKENKLLPHSGERL